jgi:site-specific recombinase XerC
VARLKGSLAGEFPLSPAVHSALTAWLKIRGSAPGPLSPSRESGLYSNRISCNRLDSLIRGYAIAAGLPPHLCHMHALKHARGTHMVGKSADLYAVTDWMGHKAFLDAGLRPVQEPTA